MGMWEFLQRFRGHNPPPVENNALEQEHLFRTRYECFQRLLAANNACLDLMASLDAARRGERHFGMHFLRSTATALLAKTYAMVDNLTKLAPEKYDDLRTVLQRIAEDIGQRLTPRVASHEPSLVLDLEHIHAAMSHHVGAKMAHLGELRQLGLPVPDGFAITAAACQAFFAHEGLGEEIACILQSRAMAGALFDTDTPDADSFSILEVCSRIQSKILAAPVPAAVAEAIRDGYIRLAARLGYSPQVALRSSAVGEDAAGTTFAGQHRSLLNLTADSLLEGYKEVLASKFSPQATVYRYRKGIREDEVFMAVGCLAMVPTVAGGVAYSRNPVSPEERYVHIVAALGAAKGVVDGSVPTDHYAVDNAGTIRERGIASKTWRIVHAATEGVRREAVAGAMAQAPCLSDAQVLELAQLVRTIEAHYGLPQDVEWGLTPEGRLVLFQARPLEIRSASPPQDATAEALPTPLLCAGVTASPGVGCGPVHILRQNVDMMTMPARAVVVCEDALPKWAAVLPQASALVAERGSVAGHLGTVAREFRIPALFGVPQGTQILRNAHEITLDADARCIYSGRVEVLLSRCPTPPSLAGTPVYETLERLIQAVIPLTLTDPESPRFQPRFCATLHDITRFCHEKAVVEMFAFGRDHPFSPRASKQLRTNVPMQWWVLNLDDGFAHEVHGRYVDLANITSIPMLALWRGIVAFPWEGPPGLDGGGFLSVLFHSSTNPNLEVAVPSAYANKNYFMIAKYFCSMQSRFGYHFTSVEAMAGPRPRENFIRFQFKGGAADDLRRARRAQLVAELLEQFHFQTQVRGDNLQARMDDCDAPFIEKHLEILGHLIMHTRQLDMVMSQDDIVAAYRTRLLGQMRWLFAQPLPGGHHDPR